MINVASTHGIPDNRKSAKPKGDALQSRNSGAIVLDIVFALTALAPLLALVQPPPLAWVGVPISLVFVISAIVEMAGTHLDDLIIRCPARIVPFFPLIALHRREVDVTTIRSVVVQGRWFFLQRIFLECPGERVRLLFATRKARLAFVETIQSHDPYVQVYRV